jgi:hypothetical protein
MLNHSVALNWREIQTVWHIYHNEPLVRSCINKIVHAIFSGGLSLNSPGKGPAPTEDFEHHLESVWIPFATEVIVNFALWGFCPYIVNKARGKDRRVVRYPVALPYGTYEVHTEVDKNYETSFVVYQRAYRAQPLKLNKPDARVKIGFYNNGTRPSMDGRLNTQLASLAETIADCDEFTHYALQAESIRTQPTLFLESTPDSRRFEEVSRIRAFDGKDIEEANTESQAYNSYKRYEAAAMAQRNSTMLTDVETPVSNRSGRRFKNHARLWEQNLFCVPEGTQLSSNVPRPEPRNDLLALTEHKEDLICAALGVPKNLMFQGGARSGNAADATTAGSNVKTTTFRRTVDSYKEALLVVLNDIYHEIYKTTEDLLSLPGAPLVDPELVLTAYDRGVIDGEVMQRYMMRAMNASQNDASAERMQQFDKHHVKTLMENELLMDPSAGVPKPEPSAQPPKKKLKK